MITFFTTFWRLTRSVFKGLQDAEFRGLFFLVLLILISGTLFYHTVEGWTWVDSLYFSVTTLSTVGYGDFVPHTDMGKIFTTVYIFAGMGIVFSFLTSVAHQARSQSNFFRDTLEDTVSSVMKKNGENKEKEG